MVDEIRDQARTAIMELLKVANLQEEDIVVVGCSSSEVGGHAIGTESSTDIADAIFAGIYPVSVSYTHPLWRGRECLKNMQVRGTGTGSSSLY